MPMVEQPFPIPLRGLDTLGDPKTAPPGALVIAENCVVRKQADGRFEYAKRYGNTALGVTTSSGGSISSGKRMGVLDDELLIHDGNEMYARSTAFAKWFQRGRGPRGTVQVDPFAWAAEDQVGGDVAVTGNYACFVWQEITFGATSGRAYCSVKDLDTGAFLLVRQQVDGALLLSSPRVVALGSVFVIAWKDGADVETLYIDTATAPATLAGGVTLATDGSATNHFDMVAISSTQALIAYRYNGPGLKIIKVNTAGASVATSTLAHATAGDQSIGWVQWDFSDGNAYLAEGSSVVGVRHHTVATASLAFSAATVVDAAATDIRNATGYYDSASTAVRVVYDVESATSYNYRVMMSGTVVVRSGSVASKVWRVGTRWYVVVAYDSTTQGGFVAIDITYGVDAGVPGRRTAFKMLIGTGAGKTYFTGSAGSVAAYGSTRYLSMLASKTKVETDAGGSEITYGMNVATFEFDAGKLGPWVKAGHGFIIPGGAPLWYDGQSIVELGFHQFPETPTVADTGGGGIGAGTYRWIVEAQWFDNAGNLHRAVSLPSAALTLGAGRTATVTIPTLRITDKNNDYASSPAKSDIVFNVYRTLNGGTAYYKVTSLISPTLRLNDVTADTITVADQYADATIDDAEELFTNTGELEPIGPPSCRCVAVFNNHVILASSEKPELWISKELRDGFAPEFSDELVVDLPGGFVHAMAEMDGRLVLFHDDSVSSIQGPGPNDLGVGLFDPPQPLKAVPHGIVDPRPFCVVPDGIIYKTANAGLRLLDRGLNDSYIGSAVDENNSLTFTGAVALPNALQARFVTSDGETQVYHWQARDERGRGLWTVHTNQAAVDCCMWQGKFTWLRSDGVVRQETTAYSDNGSNITQKLRTAWIAPGLLTEARLWQLQELAEYKATHTHQIALAYDYDSTAVETFVEAVTASSVPPLGLDPARQLFKALQFTIEETSQTEGFTISALALTLGVDGKLARLTAAARMAPT